MINLEFGFTCVCLVITFLHSNPQPRVLQIQDNKFTERLMLVVLATDHLTTGTPGGYHL